MKSRKIVLYLLSIIMLTMLTGCFDSSKKEVLSKKDDVDITKPVITLNGEQNITLIQNEVYVEAGATANDDIDGDINVIISGEVDITIVGSYAIKYNVKDSSNNEAVEVVRTVNVVLALDTEAPVITLNGESAIELIQGTTYNEQGATVSDNRDSSLVVVIAGTVDVDTIGSYAIKYNVKDSSNNEAVEVVRTVNVVLALDTEAPVITLNGESAIELIQGTTYNEQGATVSDNRDDDLVVVITGTVDVDTIGSYTVKYNVKDSSDNQAVEVVRTVNVVLAPKNNFKVTLQTTEKIAGYEIHLKFTDDTSVQADVVMNNSFLGTTGRTVNDLGADINNNTKEIKFGGFTFGSQEGVAGEFDVMTLKSNDSTSQITIVKQSCVDKDANDIACDVEIVNN